MKKDLIPRETWDKMTDIEKMRRTAQLGFTKPVNPRPTYTYLLLFIQSASYALEAETKLRKQMQMALIIQSFILVVWVVLNVTGGVM